MGEPRKLTVSDIKRVTGIAGKQYKRVSWHTTEIVLRTFLPIDDYVNMIHSIINYCMDDNGRLDMSLIDFSIRVSIILYYAFIELPDDIDEVYRIVYCTDLYETITRYATSKQIESVYRTVDIILRGE